MMRVGMTTTRRLLVIGERIEPLERVLPLLRRAEVTAQRVYSLGGARSLVQKERFDLIIAHVPDIRTALARAASLTRPGGYWLIETSDRASARARRMGARWHFYSPPSASP